MSFASAPDRSRNGPMRCPPNLPRSTRPDASSMPFPGLEAIAFRVARIVAALAKRRRRGRRPRLQRPDSMELKSHLVDEIKARAPKLRGRLTADAAIAEATWFRVGGPAEALFSPADEDDLAYVLSALPREIPVTAIGLGSNLIVRDGGVAGLVIRLGGRAFGAVEILDRSRIVAGAATPDLHVAKAAAIAGVDGLAFLRGVPGSIGGALVMNAGAHGGEVKDALVEVRGIDRTGAKRVFSNAEMGFSYRHSSAPDDVVFTGATFQGRPGDSKAIEAEMERITRAREASQPIREKTGGSTFKNPPRLKAWELIDKAGCRGLRLGGAQVSTMHCNFLINLGDATAADLEALGEEVKRRVFETAGVALEWEIKRIGAAAPRRPAVSQEPSRPK